MAGRDDRPWRHRCTLRLLSASTPAMPDKPHSPSCDRNQEPILDVLRAHFADRGHVLEIGSGTGQHAVHFAAHLPHLTWQASDVAEYLPGIRLWRAEAELPNLPEPLELDVAAPWPAGDYDAAFSANTVHIMGEREVETLFASLPRLLSPGAPFAIYGPFNYGGRYTSDSNARFGEGLVPLNAKSRYGKTTPIFNYPYAKTRPALVAAAIGLALRFDLTES